MSAIIPPGFSTLVIPEQPCCVLWPCCDCEDEDTERDEDAEDRPLTIRGREVTVDEYYEFHYGPPRRSLLP